MREKRLEDAVAYLHRAVSLNRDDRSYALTLATALASAGQLSAAERALLAIRQSGPEDPAVNIELARLAARRNDFDTAVRFYRNALYAPWTSAEGPRAVRAELIQFLLSRGETARALPEILAATTDLPDTIHDRLQVAGWFAAAGDERHALDQYRRALRLEADNRAALDGAGLAAFALGDYTRAVRYLRSTRSLQAAHAREVAELVLARDPLVAGIGTNERRRRSQSALHHVRSRLETCSAAGVPAELSQQLERFEAAVRRRPDLETITELLKLVARIERETMDRCPGAGTLDEALVRIARRHDADPS
jgi:tetratricopeptide (TPR) repeat protein